MSRTPSSLRHKIEIILCLCLLLSQLARCSDVSTTPDSSGKNSASRIICMAPSITEVVYALGQGHRVAGVSDFCVYPPEAKEKPFCGGRMNTNLEVLSKLQPDLIILEGEHEKLRKFCERRSIPYLPVNLDSIDKIKAGIEAISRKLGCEDEGRLLLSHITEAFDEIKRAVANQPRPKVFLALGHKQGSLGGIYTSGGERFLSEIIELTGGEDIFKDILRPYPKPSLEALIKRAPDIILEMHPGENLNDEEIVQLSKDWESFPSIPAVKTGRIEMIHDDYVLIPGPRITMLARKLASLFHPGTLAREKN